MNRVVLGASSEMTGGVIDWTIPNFTRFSTYSEQLTSFGGGELQTTMPDRYVWTLGFNPSPLPANIVEGTRVSFRLDVRRTKPLSAQIDAAYNGRVAVRFRLIILDNTGKEIHCQGSDPHSSFRSEHTFFTRAIEIKEGRGSLTEDISSQRIWNPTRRAEPLLYNDTLNVRMAFEYVSNVSLTYYQPQVVALPSLESDSELANDYIKLYQSKEGTDFILTTEHGAEFSVHRTVLQARSKYFAAMLTMNFKEQKNGRCTLPDVDAQTLEVILRFMYGGLSAVPMRLSESVLVAADKYQFSQLKGHCEALLMGQVMIGTAAHLLILADKYTAPKLREACLKMIKNSFKIFKEVGGMKKLEADGSGDLLKVVKDIVEPKQPS